MSSHNRIFRERTGHFICPICRQPVTLETCKTDEDGQAMHEGCYVEKVISKDTTAADKKKDSAHC